MRELAEEGFDVGLHGSYNSALDAELLRSERDQLSELVGRAVTTTRQHYLHFGFPATPRAQEAAGLRTDSTLGFNRNIGFRAGTSLPFHFFDAEARVTLDVLEVPLVVQESPLLAANALELGPRQARRTIADMLEKVARVEGVATMLFHPHSLVDSRHQDLYGFALEHAAEQGAWITSLAEIDAWWRGREARLGFK
jgi:hypothetical protein